MDASLFYQGIKIGLTIAIPIGPIALICIRRSLSESFAWGLAFALGTATADAIYAILGALSISAINQFISRYQTSIELIGIAVILYLGISALRHGTPKTANQACDTNTLLETYFSMIAITLTSPMTILLFAGVFAGTGTNVAATNYSGLITLTAGVFVSTAIWFIGLSALVITCRKWFTPRHVAWINSLAGILIILFALQRLYTVFLS
jgi:threonine/homoserine/homoserine lactone efflux protein